MENASTIARLLERWPEAAHAQIERKAVYRFHARACQRFSKGRVFLAGDAAHVTPPFVGQGLVAGLRDAANLAWKLAWVVRDRASTTILDSYDQERRPHALKMIALAKLMGRLIMPRGYLRALLLHGSMALLRQLPPLRRFNDELGLKPSNALPRGLFARGGKRGRRGASLPQGLVRAANGSQVLSDDLLGAELALVGLGIDPTHFMSERSRRQWSRAGGRTLHWAAPGEPLAVEPGSHEDSEGRFIPGVGPSGWCIVVRPDRTILHDGPARDTNQMVRESLRLLGCPAA
jgi:3-(3-hydroxy-phenyl)propionate hydroxylase